MASIKARNGKFLVRVRLNGFKLVARTLTTRKDAQAFGRKVESDMESGRWAQEATRAPSLREAIKAYRTTIAPAMKGAAAFLSA